MLEAHRDLVKALGITGRGEQARRLIEVQAALLAQPRVITVEELIRYCNLARTVRIVGIIQKDAVLGLVS